MNANKKTARIVGALFLIAMATSLIGGIWLESILTAPDYLLTVSANETQVIIGVLLELINCVAVIGIAVMMFPIFKKTDEALALGYVALRIVEAVILVVAVISPLTLVTLSQEYVTAGAPDASYFETLGTLLMAARAHVTGLLVPIFFCLGALLFYDLLYQAKLVPRFIAVWGFIAVGLVLTWNVLETFGFVASVGINFLFVLPIMLNEVFLGIWLIAKGFNSSAIAPESA